MLNCPTELAHFFDFLQYEKRYAQHTLTSYKTDLESFFSFSYQCYGALPVAAIKHTHIRTWLAGLKDKGITAKTINRKISSLKSFFKYQLKTGGIHTSPMTKLVTPKVGSRLPTFLKEKDVQTLIATLSTATDDWKSLNARMLITLFYTTGMRLSELIGLRPSQIDSSRGHIKVLGKGNKERILPISKEVIQLLNEYQSLKKKDFETADETILLVTEKGKKLYPRYAWQMVHTQLAQITTLEKKSPHVLRHSFATHLLNNGADLNAVKELLGHSSLAATQVYTHNTIDKLKNVHQKAHPKA
jgi:integrase/recombinase XerC